MRERFSLFFDWTLNLLTVALLAYISIFLLRPHAGLSAARNRPSGPEVGQAVQISSVVWSKSRHTLVLALSTKCHFCADSAGFYRELMKMQRPGDWQAVAVLPQPVGEAAAYMRTKGYSTSEVRQADLSSLGVVGTPTLLLVDQDGKLQQKWVGRLSHSQENEVGEALGLGKLPDPEPEAGVAVNSTRSEPTGGNAQGSAVSSPQGSLSGGGPAGTRTVRLERIFPDDPVRIVQVLEGDADVTPGGQDPVTLRPYKTWNGKPFQAGDDWLSRLVVVMRNSSNKDIVAGSLGVDVPEVGHEIPSNDTPYVAIMARTFYLGIVPAHALFARDGHKIKLPVAEPIQVLPGQEIRFPLEPHSKELEDSMPANRSKASVTTCWVRLHFFYFADGTRWAQFAGFQKPDLSVPGKYVRISVEEFRGTPPSGAQK